MRAWKLTCLTEICIWSQTVKTGLTFEPWFYRIVLQGVLCIMICYVFLIFCNNIVSVGWSSFCFTEAGLCRHWQRNVRTCIWGVCIICTCKCRNSKWNLGLKLLSIFWFFFVFQLQHLYLCVWPDRFRKVIHHDGKTRGWSERNYTTSKLFDSCSCNKCQAL